MAVYQDFTTTRTAPPDRPALIAALLALDATAGVGEIAPGRWRIKKATAWTAPQIAAAQSVLDTAPATSPQLSAQAKVDQMDVFDKAIILTILDQVNVIRSLLSPPLGAITVLQMTSAIRTKAGEL